MAKGGKGKGKGAQTKAPTKGGKGKAEPAKKGSAGKAQKTEQRTETKTATKTFDKLKEQVLNALANRDESQIELVESCAEVKRQEAYRDWGYETFKAFCFEMLGVHFTTVNRWLQIWDKITWLELTRARMKKIGWTKLCVLAAKADESTKKKLIKAAESNNLEAFEAIVKKTLGKPTPPGSGMSIKIPAGSTQLPMVVDALKRAGEINNNKDPVFNLGTIVSEWLSTQESAVPSAVPPDKMADHLNKVYPGTWSYDDSDVDLNLAGGEDGDDLDGLGEDGAENPSDGEDESDKDLEAAIDSLGDLGEDDDDLD